MSIQFKVIDTTCEAADRAFFPPAIRLQTKSTTQVATVYGYGEFVPSSTIPKRYHTITFNGFSQRIGFTAEPVARQCAGGKYLYSGVGNISAMGVQTSNYKKDFYAQCAKQFWPIEPIPANPVSIRTGGPIPQFVAFCWPDEPKSCAVCDPNDLDWPFLGNVATNNPQADLKAFLSSGGNFIQTATSFSINDIFTAQTEIDGTLNFPHEPLPDGSGGFITSSYILWTDTNIYSAVLSNESTDAEALANAVITVGTGATAQTNVRTTGLPALVGKVSTSTSVVFTLFASDLIAGQNYLITVDLWDIDQSSSTNTHTTRSYGITASATTQTLTDIVPTPALNHTITVQKPTIAFA